MPRVFVANKFAFFGGGGAAGVVLFFFWVGVWVWGFFPFSLRVWLGLARTPGLGVLERLCFWLLLEKVGRYFFFFEESTYRAGEESRLRFGSGHFFFFFLIGEGKTRGEKKRRGREG